MNKKFKPEDYETHSGVLDFKMTKEKVFWGNSKKARAGILWILREHGKDEKEHFLSGGDHLVIYGKEGEVIFDETIFPVPNLNCKEEGGDSLSLCVHWTQKEISAEKWASFFIRPDGEPPYRAVLLKKKK